MVRIKTYLQYRINSTWTRVLINANHNVLRKIFSNYYRKDVIFKKIFFLNLHTTAGIRDKNLAVDKKMFRFDFLKVYSYKS